MFEKSTIPELVDMIPIQQQQNWHHKLQGLH